MPRFRQSLALVVVPLLAAATPVAAQVETRPGSLPGDSSVTLRTVEIKGSATGIGKVLAANALTRADLELRSPGTTPLKAVERLPGVNFNSSDPFGSYEWSTTVTMRGFQSGQIGQTFDGITLGNMQYGNFNGLGVGRAIDPENLEDATVTQGAGALGTFFEQQPGRRRPVHISGPAQPGQLYAATDARRCQCPTYLRSLGFRTQG